MPLMTTRAVIVSSPFTVTFHRPVRSSSSAAVTVAPKRRCGRAPTSVAVRSR